MRKTIRNSALSTASTTETISLRKPRGSFLLRSLALPVAAVMGAGALMMHAPEVAMAAPPDPTESASASASASVSASETESAEKARITTTAQNLVDAGHPAALAAVTKADGSTVGVAVGKGNLETGEAPPLDGEVRIGSNTKTFVAVVIMQLVQEGKITLDEPIETYLPGLLHGEGIATAPRSPSASSCNIPAACPNTPTRSALRTPSPTATSTTQRETRSILP